MSPGFQMAQRLVPIPLKGKKRTLYDAKMVLGLNSLPALAPHVAPRPILYLKLPTNAR